MHTYAIRINNVFKVYGQKITKNNILSSNNFAKIADFVYAEEIPDQYYEEIKSEHTVKIRSINGYTLYKTKQFELFENCIIFSHVDFLHGLFNHLKKVNEFKNIILITSQSDTPISKSLFRKKPKCVSLWFSTNVNYSHSKLIPIPLGIANIRNTKNIIYEDYLDIDLDKQKQNKIYANFNLNTNYFHRYKALKKFIDNKLLFLEKPKQSYINYLNNLVESKYTLTPWGNGYDTHRIWESLYTGSIPVTKKHQAFSNFANLPIILLESYSDFDRNAADLINCEELNYEALTINWWKNIIRGDLKGDYSNVILFEENETQNYDVIFKFQKNIKKTNKIKKIVTTLRKLHKKFIGKEINDLISI